MRQQSDPTQELTPGKNNNNRALTESKTLSKCGNEDTIYSFNFEAQSEQTDDQSSFQDDASSLFCSVMSTGILDRRTPKNLKQKSECDKENSRQDQNKSSQNLNKSQSLQNKEKKYQDVDDSNQSKTVKITQNNSQKNNQIDKIYGDNQNRTAPILKSKNQDSLDSTDNQSNLQKSDIKSKTEDIYTQRNNEMFQSAKESMVSNAQSSFVDDQTQVERKYSKKLLKGSDEKCMSNCSIF